VWGGGGLRVALGCRWNAVARSLWLSIPRGHAEPIRVGTVVSAAECAVSGERDRLILMDKAGPTMPVAGRPETGEDEVVVLAGR
jgi:hypothetical protein